MFTSWSSSSNGKEDVFPPKMQILYYSAVHRKRIGPLYPIHWLFLNQFLIFLYVSSGAWVTQEIATNCIRIGQFVWELCHFKDKWWQLLEFFKLSLINVKKLKIDFCYYPNQLRRTDLWLKILMCSRPQNLENLKPNWGFMHHA